MKKTWFILIALSSFYQISIADEFECEITRNQMKKTCHVKTSWGPSLTITGEFPEKPEPISESFRATVQLDCGEHSNNTLSREVMACGISKDGHEINENSKTIELKFIHLSALGECDFENSIFIDFGAICSNHSERIDTPHPSPEK